MRKRDGNCRHNAGYVNEYARSSLRDPVSAFMMTLATLPLLATTALGHAYSGKLAGIGFLVGLALYPVALRQIDRVVAELGAPGIERRTVIEHYVRCALVGLLLSLPITLGMLSSDLDGMAVSAVVATSTDSKHFAGEIGIPSYSVCSPLKAVVGYPLSKPCYHGVGYLHLWQTRPALPIMIALAGLCVGLPLQLIAQIRVSSVHRPGAPA